ncbi:MAG: hypothetical protein EAX95_11125 [Candidatus Thorarchaeota archaeon]|nr:hypothetical protein [Candidatus Thorarchaeota archaeon]
MEIFLTLEDAKTRGTRCARLGEAPTIYELETGEYAVVMKGKWPPQRSWPILKWAGASQEWIPILARLDSFNRAQEACGLFKLLGLKPIVVEFPGITFDVFLKERNIPIGAWVVINSDGDNYERHLHQNRFYDEDDSEEIETPWVST